MTKGMARSCRSLTRTVTEPCGNTHASRGLAEHEGGPQGHLPGLISSFSAPPSLALAPTPPQVSPAGSLLRRDTRQGPAEGGSLPVKGQVDAASRTNFQMEGTLLNVPFDQYLQFGQNQVFRVSHAVKYVTKFLSL